MGGRRRCLLLLCILSAFACPAKDRPRSGLRVGHVGPSGGAAQAGLQVGDRILGYRRAAEPPANPQEQAGRLATCAELAELEVEQAPRGPFHLQVERDGRNLSLLLPAGDWGLAPEAAPADPACQPMRDALRAHDAHQLDAEEAAYAGAARWAKTARRPLFRAWALEKQGTLRVDRNDFEGAVPLLDEALRLRQEAAPGSLAEASSWHALGRLERVRGDYEKAQGHLHRALALRARWAPSSAEHAGTLNNLGITAWISGHLDDAERLYTQAHAVVRRRAAGTLNEAQVLNNLGIVTKQRERLAEAERYFQASYRITLSRDPEGLGITFSLTSLGTLAFDRGNYALSESYHLATLERYRKAIPNGLEVANTLYNLALIADKRRDLAGSTALLRESLAIRHRLVPDTPIEADTLSVMSDNAMKAGRLEEARQIGERALALHSKLAPESDAIALSISTLAQIALVRRDLAEAERLAKEEVAHRRGRPISTRRQLNSLQLMGEIAEAKGDDEAARRHYSARLEVLKAYRPPEVELADGLYTLGKVELRTGHKERAEANFRAAIEVLEEQMKMLGGTEEQLLGFEEDFLPIYLDLIELQLERGDKAGALHTLERSRGRGLLSLLSQRDLVFSADLPAPLRERKRSLDHEQAALQRALAEIDPRQKGEVAARRKELQHLSSRRAALSAEIARTSPRYSALKNPQALDLAGITRTLDPGTVYLAYALGKERSHLFVVAGGQVEEFPLAVTREAVGREVGIFRSLLLLSAKDPAVEKTLLDQARRLYGLLVAPAEPVVRKAQRILVSPDGALHLLPFGALRRQDGSYLIEGQPLHTVVSATLYAELRSRRRVLPSIATMAGAGAAAASKLRAPVQLAAFADPSYPKPRGQAGPEDTPLRRYSLGLPALPASLDEARSLASLYGSAAKVYVGPSANERQATRLPGGVRIVHFASHALLDRHFPLDSALALSTPAALSLDGSDDGLLQAWEILERVRLDADLVTLSACGTGLGGAGGGEGLIGLTRAFQYAGARSILASLWSVSDRSTAELMKRFYGALRGGLPKDQALRQAQVELLRDDNRNLSHPYHWAAFEMIGDWL